MEAGCYVVKNSGKYFSQAGAGHVYYADDIQKANRFENLRGAEFMAKRLGGQVVLCEMKDGLIRESEAA